MTRRVTGREQTHTGYTARHEKLLRKHAKPTGPIENVNTVSSSGSALTLPDVTTATIHDVTLDDDCTITLPTATKGKTFAVFIVQGSGPYTVTWDSQAKWDGGSAPTLSTGDGDVDGFWFVCRTDGRYECGVGGQGFA